MGLKNFLEETGKPEWEHPTSCPLNATGIVPCLCNTQPCHGGNPLLCPACTPESCLMTACCPVALGGEQPMPRSVLAPSAQYPDTPCSPSERCPAPRDPGCWSQQF